MAAEDNALGVGQFRKLREVEFPWTAEALYMNSAAIGPLPERTRRYLDDFSFKRAAPHRLDNDESAAVQP